MGKTKAEAKRLYKFRLDYGRHGDLEGVFAATEQEVTAALGMTCDFGEVLGKHSEVSCVLTPAHVKVLTTDPGFIAKAEEYGLVPSGHNPLQAITCKRCGDKACRKRAEAEA